MSMLNALYVTRNDEGPEFEKRVTAALRSAHLRRLPISKAVAGVRPDTAPDLIIAGLSKYGTAVLEVKGLRRRFPGIAIVITGGKLSREVSAQFYRAGATANSSTGCPRRCDHQSGTSVRGRKAERGACFRSNN